MCACAIRNLAQCCTTPTHLLTPHHKLFGHFQGNYKRVECPLVWDHIIPDMDLFCHLCTYSDFLFVWTTFIYSFVLICQLPFFWFGTKWKLSICSHSFCSERPNTKCDLFWFGTKWKFSICSHLFCPAKPNTKHTICFGLVPNEHISFVLICFGLSESKANAICFGLVPNQMRTNDICFYLVPNEHYDPT